MTTAAARPHGSLLAHDDGPLIMGIVNANADSFSDPRATMGPEAVIAEATELVDAGADLLDIGGQTASPAVAEISLDEELTRVLPVIEALAAELPQVPLSVDTYRLEVAEAALQAGASVLNNIIGAQHAEFAALAVRHDALHVITHNPGAPKTKLLENDRYGDVVEDVAVYFRAQLDELGSVPGALEATIIDPGIDLAKTPAQSLELLRRASEFDALGVPVLMAISRKDVIGVMTESPPDQRLAGTLAVLGHLRSGGQRIFRLHDVAEARRYLDVCRYLEGENQIDAAARLAPELRRRQA